MNQSQNIEGLAKALIKFQLKMKTVGYDASNPFFKSKYATLTALVTESKAELANCGLVVSQIVENDGGVTTILMHESGQFISGTLTLKPVKDDPQGHGSAITYSRRYAYASILGLVSDEDDDGNAASQPKANGKPEVKMPTPKPDQVNRSLSIKELVLNAADKKFATREEFQMWRTNKGLVDTIDKANDLQLSKVLMELKELKDVTV